MTDDIMERLAKQEATRIRDSYPMADPMHVEAEDAARRDDLTPAHDFLRGLGSAAVVYLVVALFTFAWMAS